MLSQKSHVGKTIYCMFSSTRNAQKREIYETEIGNEDKCVIYNYLRNLGFKKMLNISKIINNKIDAMVIIPIYLYFQYFIIHVFLYCLRKNVLIKQFPTTIGTMPQHQV